MTTAKNNKSRRITYWVENKCRTRENCSHNHNYQNLIFREETKIFNQDIGRLNDEYVQGGTDKILVKVSTFS